MLHSIDVYDGGIISLDNLARVNYIVSPSPVDSYKVLQAISRRQKRGAYWLDYSELEQMINGLSNFPRGLQSLLIRNPEFEMYPDRQKNIAFALNEVNRTRRVQIFVTTNSPFVVSASAGLTEKEFQASHIAKDQFWPSQKVYYIKDGRVASRRGLITLDMESKPKGRMGYWGKKAGYVASQMIGSGLMLDVVNSYTPDSPILILCEGQNSEADALIYNQIFDNYESVSGRSAMFVSCLGSSQLSVSFDLLRQVKKSLSANFELLMLRDRDHEFPNHESIDVYKKSYPQRRVLLHRAIEAYIYNSETANLVLQFFDKPLLTTAKKTRMDKLQATIQQEAESGYLGNDYKIRLKTLFRSLLGNIQYQWEERAKSDPKYKFSVEIIARLITPDTQTYKDLAKDIFELNM